MAETWKELGRKCKIIVEEFIEETGKRIGRSWERDGKEPRKKPKVSIFFPKFLDFRPLNVIRRL